MYRQITQDLVSFIKKSPSVFHAVHQIESQLQADGFTQLQEGRSWSVVPGGKYYVKRNGSSIIALKVGGELTDYNFQITASHCDSPTFKLKENAELQVAGKYTQLNTEGYGGMLRF